MGEVEIHIIVRQNVRPKDAIWHHSAEFWQVDRADERPEIRQFDTRNCQTGQRDCSSNNSTTQTPQPTRIHHGSC